MKLVWKCASLILWLQMVVASFVCPPLSLDNPLRTHAHRHCSRYLLCVGAEVHPREVSCLIPDWVYDPAKFMCVPLAKGTSVHDVNPGCIPSKATMQYYHDPNGISLPMINDYDSL